MTDKRATDLTELTAVADNDLLYVVDVSDTADSAAGSSRKIQAKNARGIPATSAESAVVIVNYNYLPGNVLRYGTNTTPGTTDMTAALTAAIAQQQAGGAVVQGIPDEVFLVSTWAAITTTAPLRINGNGMTIRCGNSTRVSFVTVGDDFDIEGITFDGFYRIIDNPAGTAGSISEGRFHKNYCINATVGATNFAYYILLSNAFNKVWITENYFADGIAVADQQRLMNAAHTDPVERRQRTLQPVTGDVRQFLHLVEEGQRLRPVHGGPDGVPGWAL
jgi:hypothetical protein